MDSMGIKRRRILHRFQKYKLTFVTKCIEKKLFGKGSATLVNNIILQLVEAIAELQSQGYKIPNYNPNPTTDEEKEAK
jgi:hypothetical protein